MELSNLIMEEIKSASVYFKSEVMERARQIAGYQGGVNVNNIDKKANIITNQIIGEMLKDMNDNEK